MRIDSRQLRLGLTVALIAFILVVALISVRPDAVLPNVYAARTAGNSIPDVVYDHADFAFADSPSAPEKGWSRRALPDFTLLATAQHRRSHPPSFWARIRFDRSTFGNRALALNCNIVRNYFTVFLNGAIVYRSRGEGRGWAFGWNHPLFVSLPPTMLREGVNEIVFHVETAKPSLLGIGVIGVGTDASIRSTTDGQYFVGNVAPQIVGGYLLIVTTSALSFWARRPRDRVYGWIALVGVVWLFRNLHYYAQGSLIDPEWFWNASTDAVFVLMAAVYGFAISYFALPRARLLRLSIFGLCWVEILLRHFLIGHGRSELASFLLTIPMTGVIVVALLRACLAHSRNDYWLMFFAIVAALIGSFHDMLYSFNIVKGVGFFLQPYGGLLVFLAFDIALTTRLQDALIGVEDDNSRLETQVTDVVATLERGESEREKLQIAFAVDRERERIMRDIHDGIGASLVTALATAKHRNDSPETIATLSRSLTDLRIGVDSLEPTDGDVVGLLASLRNRMERELKGAAVSFAWKVGDVPPLPWLDPIGALHILRILQEAIGNALSHADAKVIEVRCEPYDEAGDEGILIQIVDCGGGFDVEAVTRGNGLANISARAQAVGGKFWVSSQFGAGTVISLWLPLVKPRLES